LAAQSAALAKLKNGDTTSLKDLPQTIVPFALLGRGVARAGFRVFRDQTEDGFVTSGTMVPCWQTEGSGPAMHFTGQRDLRAIGMMLADASLREGEEVAIEIRGSRVPAVVVARHLRTDSPPYAVPVIHGRTADTKP
jgi:aminomethyltransferase